MNTRMKKTCFICSPYRSDPVANTEIARRLCRQALAKGYAPFAPHLLYTQMLDDTDESERAAGIDAGLFWLESADEMWVYAELGISEGMAMEINMARAWGIPVVHVGLEADTVPRPVCKWLCDREGTWETACGELFQFIDGGPEENRVKFCHYCGLRIEATPFGEQEDE